MEVWARSLQEQALGRVGAIDLDHERGEARAGVHNALLADGDAFVDVGLVGVSAWHEVYRGQSG